jgi:hypothetical protein
MFGFVGRSHKNSGGASPVFLAQVRFGEPGAPVLFLPGSAVRQTPMLRLNRRQERMKRAVHRGDGV